MECLLVAELGGALPDPCRLLKLLVPGNALGKTLELLLSLLPERFDTLIVRPVLMSPQCQLPCKTHRE